MNATKKAGKTIDIVDHDVTLTGAWSKEAIKPTEYTAIYHANNGTETTYKYTYTAGALVTAEGSPSDVGTFSVTLTDSVSFEYPDMEFKGWAETLNGTVKYAPGAEITSAIAGNYDLYAVWETSTPAGDQY